MIKEMKEGTKPFSEQKSYYEFIQYLTEESEDSQEFNECIDFDDYSK